jgi:hypothetical protein
VYVETGVRNTTNPTAAKINEVSIENPISRAISLGIGNFG